VLALTSTIIALALIDKSCLGMHAVHALYVRVILAAQLARLLEMS